MEDEEIIEQPTEPTTDPADTEEKGTKLFTQEEVNDIVRKRLERVRTEPREPSEAEKREQAIAARESRMECREYLEKFRFPKELADIIDTSNPEEFSRRATAANAMIEQIVKQRVQEYKDSLPKPHYPMADLADPIAAPTGSGFGSTKHTPKLWPGGFTTDY